MKITISGMNGSGKSTVADIIAKKLNLKRYSTGDFRREIARKKNFSLAELNKLGEKEDWTDKQADKWQEDLGKDEDNFIIDSRLGFHFIPNSIRIFLKVNPEIGAKRIMKENRKEENFKDLKEAIKFWHERINSDILRYKRYYNIDPYELSNYEFILDTSSLTIEEVTNKVLDFIKSKI